MDLLQHILDLFVGLLLGLLLQLQLRVHLIQFQLNIFSYPCRVLFSSLLLALDSCLQVQ